MQLFTPAQVLLCSLFGGPLGATYAIVWNLSLVKRQRIFFEALIAGLAFMLVFMTLWAFASSILIVLWATLIYAVGAGEFCRRYQPFDKALKQSGRYEPRSWQDAIQVSIGSCVLFALITAAWSSLMALLA